MSVTEFDELTDKQPERKLLAPLRRSGGRNALGRMTVRHIGGGHKRRYRLIDFKRNKDGIPAQVAAIALPTGPHRAPTVRRIGPAGGAGRGRHQSPDGWHWLRFHPGAVLRRAGG